MKKLTILVGLVTSTMLITASNTGTSSSSETEATRKEIIKEIFKILRFTVLLYIRRILYFFGLPFS